MVSENKNSKELTISQPANQTSSYPLRWTINPKGKHPAHIGAFVVHPDGSIGTVVGGQSTVSFGTQKAACIGDKVECPGHTGVITTGDKNVSIGGKSLAREGDKTSCGGILTNCFPTITVYGPTKAVHGKGEIGGAKEIRLQLFESAHSKQSSYIGMPYQIYIEGKELGRGIIDEDSALFFELQSSDTKGELVLGNGQRYELQFTSQPDPIRHSTSMQGITEDEQENIAYHQLIGESDNA